MRLGMGTFLNEKRPRVHTGKFHIPEQNINRKNMFLCQNKMENLVLQNNYTCLICNGTYI